MYKSVSGSSLVFVVLTDVAVITVVCSGPGAGWAGPGRCK